MASNALQRIIFAIATNKYKRLLYVGHTSLACISIELCSVPLRQSTIVVSLLNKVHSA